MAAAAPLVLVADSDRTVLELLQIRLNVAGYRAVVARTADVAIEAVRAARPAGLVVDLRLATAQGVPLLRALADEEGRLACPTLAIGRDLTPEAISMAVGLGAHDCMPKPFSGADVLERIGRMFRSPDEPAALHVIEAQCLELKDLQARYPHEAAEHRRILFARGSGMCPTWKTFRQFLADLGPAPSPQHLATRLVAGDLTYAAGKVAWMHRDHQPRLNDRWSLIEPNAGGKGERVALLRGRPIEYSVLASHLGVPVDTMAVALRNRPTADEMVEQAQVAEALAEQDAPWLAEDRRDAFMTAYRMWHLQVQPRFAATATPAFLYLFSALPGMIKSRDELVAVSLWNPPTEPGKLERAAHPQWRRYRETVPRIEAARQDFSIYRQYCLWTEIDAFWSRIKTAEERFRRTPAQAMAQAA